MYKIEKLTPEQEAKCPFYVEKWSAIGKSTSPSNKPEAEAAILESYILANVTPPKWIKWCGSPYGVMFFWAVVDKLLAQKKEEIAIQIVSTNKEIMNQEELERFLTDELGTRKGNSIIKEAKAEVKNLVFNCGYGQNDAHWLGFYDFFRTECGLVEETNSLTGLMKLAENASWYIPTVDCCYVSEKPTSLHLDDRNRLHCLEKKAIEYPDGWGLYVVHGVKVLEDIILHPETITVKSIDKEPNAEVRRIMLDIFGIPKYLEQAKMEVVSKDAFGTLYKKEFKDDPEPIYTVMCFNSTPEPDGTFKPYFIGVPPETKTPKQGLAWTFGLEEHQYNPDIET